MLRKEEKWLSLGKSIATGYPISTRVSFLHIHTSNNIWNEQLLFIYLVIHAHITTVKEKPLNLKERKESTWEEMERGIGRVDDIVIMPKNKKAIKRALIFATNYDTTQIFTAESEL